MKNIPFAVSLLYLRKDYFVLGVARKDEPNNFGLPGGKVEKSESLRQAIARETKEETGLSIWRVTPVFTRLCLGGLKGTDYMNTTFIANSISGLPKQQKGEGRIAWIPYELLFFGSFNDYNFKLMEHLGVKGITRDYSRQRNKFLSRIEEL